MTCSRKWDQCCEPAVKREVHGHVTAGAGDICFYADTDAAGAAALSGKAHPSERAAITVAATPVRQGTEKGLQAEAVGGRIRASAKDAAECLAVFIEEAQPHDHGTIPL